MQQKMQFEEILFEDWHNIYTCLDTLHNKSILFQYKIHLPNVYHFYSRMMFLSTIDVIIVWKGLFR